MPTKLFIIYAREDRSALQELKGHLRPLELRRDLTVWDDGEILPGEDWGEAIKANLLAADIILLLVSSSFFTSDYIEKEELKKALKRHKKGKAVVMPVIVSSCLWEAYPKINTLQALPKGGKAVSTWGNRDEAWEDVARGILTILEETKADLNKKRTQSKVDKEIAGALLSHLLGNAEKACKVILQYASEWPIHPEAYFLLGQFYHNGQAGLEINYEEAVKWYRKAAEKGYALGQTNLGVMYVNGQGVEKDYSEAIKWYRKAAEQKNAIAQNNLAAMYEDGHGVTKDLSTAIYWYRKAAKKGQKTAKENLKRLGYSE